MVTKPLFTTAAVKGLPAVIIIFTAYNHLSNDISCFYGNMTITNFFILHIIMQYNFIWNKTEMREMWFLGHTKFSAEIGHFPIMFIVI